MKKFYFAIFFLLLFHASFSTNTSTIKELTFSSVEYPPLTGEKLAYGGIITRIVREAFATQGIKVNVVWVPNNRAISGAMYGNYDGTFGWAYTEERAKKLLYSKSVVYNFRMVFFHKKGKYYPWKSLKELAPYTIGATLGNFYSDEFTELQNSNKLKVEFSPSDELNIRKLSVGRIDLFPMEQEGGIFLINSALPKNKRNKIVYQNNAIWEVPTYLQITKKRSDAKEIIELFDKGYELLKSNGKLQIIINETRKERVINFV